MIFEKVPFLTDRFCFYWAKSLYCSADKSEAERYQEI